MRFITFIYFMLGAAPHEGLLITVLSERGGGGGVAPVVRV